MNWKLSLKLVLFILCGKITCDWFLSQSVGKEICQCNKSKCVCIYYRKPTYIFNYKKKEWFLWSVVGVFCPGLLPYWWTRYCSCPSSTGHSLLQSKLFQLNLKQQLTRHFRVQSYLWWGCFWLQWSFAFHFLHTNFFFPLTETGSWHYSVCLQLCARAHGVDHNAVLGVYVLQRCPEPYQSSVFRDRGSRTAE